MQGSEQLMIYAIKKSDSNKGIVTAGKAKKIEAAAVISNIVSQAPNSRNPSEPTPNAYDVDFRLSLDSQDLLNGIILSEVFGKPKCMRKGR